MPQSHRSLIKSSAKHHMSKPLKILFLGEAQSPNTLSWVEGLRNSGCEVSIASVREKVSQGQVIALGNPKLPPRLRLLLASNDLKILIRETKPDILIAYRVSSYGYLAARSGFHPLVIAAQNEQVIFQVEKKWWRTRLLTYFANFAIRHADLLHAWSQNIKKGLMNFGAREEQIMLLHRGIDSQIFTPADRPREIAEIPELISTRALFPHYRIDQLLRAFEVFSQAYPKAKLTLIGEGPEKEKLKELAGSLYLTDRVSFPGKLPPDQLAGHLQQSDLYVSLIRSEGLSASLLESCACGVLPVVLDIPASRHLLKDGENGILLPPDLPAEKIGKKLISAYEDLALRKQVATQNPPRIRQAFDRRKNLQRFLEVYQNLCRKK